MIPRGLPYHISIHVPTRGTTLQSSWYCRLQLFQSTCPRGARPPRLPISCYTVISIHVPTRGTTAAPCSVSPGYNFNPRAHEGHDPIMRIRMYLLTYFNPRAHEGHDSICRYAADLLHISIHVPTRGTTRI